jgi:hypothetical protein
MSDRLESSRAWIADPMLVAGLERIDAVAAQVAEP